MNNTNESSETFKTAYCWISTTEKGYKYIYNLHYLFLERYKKKKSHKKMNEINDSMYI